MLREHERFTQARSGIFGGEFNFQNDGADPLNTGFAFANAYIGHVTSYTESMGRRPDNRWQTTWAWFVQDTWKPTRRLTLRRRRADVQVERSGLEHRRSVRLQLRAVRPELGRQAAGAVPAGGHAAGTPGAQPADR